MITHPCDLSAQGRGEALRVILGTTLSLRPAWVTQRSCLKEISLPFCCHFVKVTQHWLPLSHRAATSALFLPLSSSRLNFRSDCQAPLKKKKILLLSSKELHRIQKSVTKSHIRKQVLRSIVASQHTQLRVCGEDLLTRLYWMRWNKTKAVHLYFIRCEYCLNHSKDEEQASRLSIVLWIHL